MCVGEMTAHTAVDPLLSSPLTISGIPRILSSSARKPILMPFLIFSRNGCCPSPPDSVCPAMPALKYSFSIIASRSWSEQHDETRAPACPSKIAKNDQFLRCSAGRPMTALWASSISTRQPCMLLRPKRSPLPLPDSLCFSVFGLSKNAPMLVPIQPPSQFRSLLCARTWLYPMNLSPYYNTSCPYRRAYAAWRKSSLENNPQCFEFIRRKPSQRTPSTQTRAGKPRMTNFITLACK
ncbi:hypothetical protein NP493_288g01042 [Ridgeia piscesae]|uniref:Uncharacterized protein n=1 Tax=Ridgeia piscesae TaxID=27915 RepID=A0AAD9UBZ4_RIDPI|nr:hypothetical protein NP493_288g01042 [Ridgeia piscesae]